MTANLHKNINLPNILLRKTQASVFFHSFVLPFFHFSLTLQKFDFQSKRYNI